jgi:hypothetical protein
VSRLARDAHDPGFLADVRSAFRVLIERPLLPFVSVVLWGVPVLLPPALSFIAFPIQIFDIGYPGTERLWLLRGMRGQPFTLDQAIHRNWSYIGRFVRTGLLLAPVFAVMLLLVWLVYRSFFGFYLGLTVLALLFDFALTFVTPALAFTTRRAREALSIGFRMIRSEWSRAFLYVLVPPFAVLMIAQLVPGIATFRHLRQDFDAIKAGRPAPSIPESIRLISAGSSALAAVIGLMLKGATVAFYARRFDVPPYGASSGPEDGPPVPPRPD